MIATGVGETAITANAALCPERRDADRQRKSHPHAHHLR